MARNKYDIFTRNCIVSDYNKGLTQKELSEKYNINKSVISRLIKKLITTGNVEVNHKGGRPRKSTTREYKLIIRQIKKYPAISSTEILRNLDLNITDRTIRNRALDAKLQNRRPASKPVISKKNRLARINFAKTYG